jgi:predicted PurR-regulated permease PerM
MAEPDSAPAPSRPFFPGGDRIAFFVGFAASLYFAWLTVRPLMMSVVLAAAVASLSHRIYVRVRDRLGGRERLGALLTVLVILFCLVTPLATVGVFTAGRLVDEAGQLAERLREGSGTVVERAADRLGPFAQPVRDALASLQPAFADVAPVVARTAARVASAVGGALVRLALLTFIFLLALYYFYLSGVAWRERLVRLLPLPDDEVRTFLARFREVSVGVLVGNLGTAFTQATIGTIGYYLFGVPLPLVWGLCTFGAALIPSVGTGLVWVPLAIWMGATVSVPRGLLLFAYGLLVIGLVDNVVRPLLTRAGLQIHPLLIFLAIFGGLASFGLKGLFLGPLAVALAVTMVEMYERRAERLRHEGPRA